MTVRPFFYIPVPLFNTHEGGLNGKRELNLSSWKKPRYNGKREQTGKIRTRSTSSRGGNGWRCDLFSIYPCPTDYAHPLGFGRPRPLCVGAIHDLLIFRPRFCSFCISLVLKIRSAAASSRGTFTIACRIYKYYSVFCIAFSCIFMHFHVCCIVFCTSCSERAAAVSRGTSYFNTKLWPKWAKTGSKNQ